MSDATLKEQLKEAIDEMPADVSMDELVERIALIYDVQQGRAELRAGKGIPHEQARERMSKWLD